MCAGIETQPNHSRRFKMAKVVRCRDVGFDCDGVVRAETEEEVLKQVAAHARSVHNLNAVSEEVVAKVRRVMCDVDAH
jgi:predicted small metal-binding protein